MFWLVEVEQKQKVKQTFSMYVSPKILKELSQNYKTIQPELGKKKEIIKKFAINEEDTGSPDVQVAILTKRISVLTGHLAKNKKDYQEKPDNAS